MMYAARWLLLVAYVSVSCLHATRAQQCLCTTNDRTQIYTDNELTTEAVVIPEKNTCFLGIKYTNKRGKSNRTYVHLKSLVASCFDGIEGYDSQTWSYSEQDDNYVPTVESSDAEYFAKSDDFFERSNDGTRKRFLTDGVLSQKAGWDDWSPWTPCFADDCNGTGSINRTRTCQHALSGATCIGIDSEKLDCHIDCYTNQPIGWSGWMEWEDCDTDCVNGNTTRKRLCLSTSGIDCNGSASDTKQCTQDLCPVDGGWTDWGQWSKCTKSTGTDGITNRFRTCNNPEPSHGGKDCPKSSYEIRACIISEWSEWESWGDCQLTATNGFLLQVRNRSCSHEDLVGTPSSSCIELNRLDYRRCSEYGVWENWGEWSNCSEDTNSTKTRQRVCNISAALDHDCDGNDNETVSCKDSGTSTQTEWSDWSDCHYPCNVDSFRYRSGDNLDTGNQMVTYRKCTEDICIVDGNWTEWSEWTSCSDFGSVLIRTRNRSCDNPEPRNGGSVCHGKATEVKLCNKEAEWGNWKEWKSCFPIAGDHGVRFRYRDCHNGTTANGTCKGEDYDRDTCILHGTWLDWSYWSDCSVTCESGTITRTRTCNSTTYSCEGNSTEQASCQLRPHCPVDGGYSDWTSWSPCPVTCGSGGIYRTRYCNNPSPAYGGNNCSSLGQSTESSYCDSPCPVDGHWSIWSSWSDCDSTCDSGTKSRYRTCTNPSPAFNGTDCQGESSSTENCTLPLCSVDGGWSQWSNWSQCSCKHDHTRHRDCNSPSPAGSGKYCTGTANETESCEPNPALACPIDGGWAEWWEWGSRCSVTCGKGTLSRGRTCTNPVPSNGGSYCPGAYTDTKFCLQSECPVDGAWTEWLGWSPCSVSCNNGSQVRDRTCDNPHPQHGGANCSGDTRETKECVQSPCPIDGGWSDWETWSSWDASCSFATRSRIRKCESPSPQYNGRYCDGDNTGTESVDLGPCPVDGKWGTWAAWTQCSVSCENGTKTRSRDCDNPTPMYNGSDCVGNQIETAVCSDKPSCKVDGNWAPWLEWFGCDVTCGPGTNTRYRTCTDPKPENGGKTCVGTYSSTSSCNLVSCPVDGAWAPWGQWRACSATCANGTQTRSRSCSQPQPKFGGKNCIGDIIESQLCQLGPCPIDGSWSNWQPWSACEETCGNTTKTRSRTCDNPPPQYNGTNCPGPNKEDGVCILTHCPVDGQYGSWLEWESCSVTCGNGTKLRHRQCDSPPPQYNGKDCVGTNESSSPCDEGRCPVDGGWGVWTKWSSCRGTCDNAMHQRVRPCDQPAPAYGGAFCVGDPLEVQPCTPDGCPTTTTASSTFLPPTTPLPTTPVTTQPPTTTSQPVTTTQPATIQPTAVSFTPQPTNASSNFQCYTCAGPLPEFCLQMMEPITCPEPYCINELTNNVNGEKMIDRRCGTKQECDKDWWTATSDNDKCTLYDDTQTVTNYIHCTFCCKDEFCNKPTVPSPESLYKPNS